MLNIFITIYGLALVNLIIELDKVAAKSIIDDIDD